MAFVNSDSHDILWLMTLTYEAPQKYAELTVRLSVTRFQSEYVDDSLDNWISQAFHLTC